MLRKKKSLKTGENRDANSTFCPISEVHQSIRFSHPRNEELMIQLLKRPGGMAQRPRADLGFQTVELLKKKIMKISAFFGALK